MCPLDMPPMMRLRHIAEPTSAMLRCFLIECAIAVLASQNMFSTIVKHVVNLLPSGNKTKRSSRRTYHWRSFYVSQRNNVPIWQPCTWFTRKENLGKGDRQGLASYREGRTPPGHGVGMEWVRDAACEGSLMRQRLLVGNVRQTGHGDLSDICGAVGAQH